MSDALKDDDQAAFLVGRFLRQFSVAEQLTSQVLGIFVGISEQQAAVLLEHVPASRKIAAFKAMAPEMLDKSDPLQEGIMGSIKKLQQASDLRNVVAHSNFRGTNNEIHFLAFITGEVARTYSFDQFTQETAKIHGALRAIFDLQRRITMQRVDKLLTEHMEKYELRQRLSAALSSTPSDG